MSGSFLKCIVVATLLMAAPPGSSAMQLDTLQAPMDLVVVLLSGQGRVSSLFVASMPPELEGALPLGADATVVGARVQGPSGTLVVQVPGDASQALTRYIDLVQSEGWERPRLPPDESGGFQRTDPFGVDVWCGDEYWIRATSMSLESRSYLKIHYTDRNSGRDACVSALGRSGSRQSLFGSLRLPVLTPPPGAAITGGEGGSSPDRMSTEATIESDLSMEALFEHYAAQLTAAGWSVEGRAIGDGVSIGRWRFQDEDGESIVGTLGIWALPDDMLYRGWLRMDRVGERWPFGQE